MVGLRCFHIPEQSMLINREKHLIQGWLIITPRMWAIELSRCPDFYG